MGSVGVAWYSQLCHVLGDASGEGSQPPVAAAHHGLHTGARLGAARAQLAAALLVACGEPAVSEAGEGELGPLPDPAATVRGALSFEPGLGVRSLLVPSVVEGKGEAPGLGNRAVCLLPRLSQNKDAKNFINQILEREAVTVNQLRSKPNGDFPGRPVVKTLCFYRRGEGLTPARATKGVSQADRRGGPGGAGLSIPPTPPVLHIFHYTIPLGW